MVKHQNDLDTTVVVRSVGEATESVCVELLEEVFGKENVFLVKNVSPFSKAVEKTFEIGIAQNKKWTMAVDADVLVFQDKTCTLIASANEHVSKCDKDIFGFNGTVSDRFLGCDRSGGPHLFRTNYLKKALEFVEKGTYKLRPELFVKTNMIENGYMLYMINLNLGIHDFFQHPRFIVKKAIQHCKKQHTTTDMIEVWKNNLDSDSDFYWAMKGVEIAEDLKDQDIIVDSVFMDDLVKKYIHHISHELPNKMDRKTIDETLAKYNQAEDVPIAFVPYTLAPIPPAPILPAPIVCPKFSPNFLESLFSVKNFGHHKILTVLGIKMSFRRKRLTMDCQMNQ